MSSRLVVALLITLALPAVPGAAQTVPAVTLPASPSGQAAIQVGGTWVTNNNTSQYRDGKWIVIDYGRPILRGRQNIFGRGADYGQAITAGAPLWRAGANATTRLTTQTALQFGGRTIQPGVYNVLVELKEDAWTLVLSTQPIQEKYDPADKVNLFGAYNYDPKFEVLRAPMSLGTAPVSSEQFTITFVDVTSAGGTLLMTWDTTAARIPFTVP